MELAARRRRDYFTTGGDDEGHAAVVPSGRTTALSLELLTLSLTAVVLVAKTLSPSVESAVVAALALPPQGMATVRAARSNRLQISLNLALGSAMASIGLTIPAVAVVYLFLAPPLTLGLAPEEMTPLVPTLFISTVTWATGRTTLPQGAMHLVILGVFLFLSAVP